MAESRANSLCGRIYRDTVHSGGRTHTDYYVDCVDCSREDALEDVGPDSRLDERCTDRQMGLPGLHGKGQ